MSDYHVISEIRSELDPLRQSSARDKLAILKASLDPSQTPYDRVPNIRRTLMSFDYFAVGASGKRTVPPACTYLYRVSSLSMVQKYTGWKEDTELPLAASLGDLQFRSAHSADREGWFPLSDVADGEFTSERCFTWWSSYPVHRNSVVCDLHLRGMPSDWIPIYALVLRCSVERLLESASVYLPSAFDGFDSVIFEAMSEAEATVSGRAVNLEDPNDLQLGADEFVLQPIPVEIIDVLPVVVDDSLREHKIFEIDLLRALAIYYKKGLAR